MNKQIMATHSGSHNRFKESLLPSEQRASLCRKLLDKRDADTHTALHDGELGDKVSDFQ